MSYFFQSDYQELAHPRIIKALEKYALEQNVPYGNDYHSENASRYIKDTFGASEAKVFFLAGGTQTNMVFISFCLKHYEAVIACNSGHINVHETAAVEGAGYKIIPCQGREGKVYKEDVLEALRNNTGVHMVKPRMVYISNSTECGTIYTQEELNELHDICKENNLYLFIDGARIGSALTASENNVDPKSLGRLCDAFYVGGTKNGLLYGEALVINNKELQEEFSYHVKNKGAMLAKGYGLGIQFEEAFKDGLYFELAKHANEIAIYLKEELIKLHIDILPSPTNQIFVSFKKDFALRLINRFALEKWEDKGETMVVRIVTSFNTSKENIDELIDSIKTNI